MTVTVAVESDAWASLPDLEEFAQRAALAALAATDAAEGELDLLFADDAAVAALNAKWRGKIGPTNVLSFPAPGDLPVPNGEERPLGDVVLAHGVVAREAAEQGKTFREHATHLIVHGVLHLLGYDHESEAEAGRMERIEIEILKGLGIPDPYERH